MSKAKTIGIIDALSGKVCSTSEYCFQTNSVTGNVYTTKRAQKKNKPPSPAQQACQESFRQAQKQASLWLREHKGSSEYDALYKQFKNQHKIGSLIGYLMHRMMINN